MAIGERIRFLRNLRGMTQKWLGVAAGFPEKSADVRIAQYEVGMRKPKEEIINTLANCLDVSPLALTVPDIDSNLGFMHTLFTLEDECGLAPSIDDGMVTLTFNNPRLLDPSVLKSIYAWADAAGKYKSGEITKDEYDNWRYHYPEYDKSQIWVKPPREVLIEEIKDNK